MSEQLIQCVLAREVLCGQEVKVVDAAVGSLRAASDGAGLCPGGPVFFLPCTSDVVPGQKGKERVQPYDEVHREEEDHLKGRFWLETHTAF